MPQKNNYTKSFSGDNNANANNEIGAHNRFVFHNETSNAITTLVVFVLIVISAIIVYMCIKFGSLVVIAVVISFTVVMAVAVTCIVVVVSSIGVRHVSTTKAQLQIDRNHEEWSRYVYQAGPHTIVRNPHTRELTVHNASIVTENRSYPVQVTQVAERAESLHGGGEDMPPASDLFR